LPADRSPLRIVHVANFAEEQDGRAFYSVDRKLSLGLIRLGHFVYDFSYRHMARYDAPFRSKRLGRSRLQKRLTDLIDQVRPDLLLLGHSELVENATLRGLRDRYPGMRIAMWYVDWLEEAHKRSNVRDRLTVADAVFCTTGGEALRAVAGDSDNLHFLPNPVDSSIERGRNDQRDTFRWDLVYCGRDYKDPVRRKALTDLQSSLGEDRLCLRGCLDRPTVSGAEYLDLLTQARCGLNYSRRNDIPFYTSDRLVQLAGNGLLTFSPRVPGLDRIFSEEEVVYFDDMDDLIEKFHYFRKNDDQRRRIARQGRERAHRDYNSSRVAKYIIDVTLGDEGHPKCDWLSI